MVHVRVLSLSPPLSLNIRLRPSQCPKRKSPAVWTNRVDKMLQVVDQHNGHDCESPQSINRLNPGRIVCGMSHRSAKIRLLFCRPLFYYCRCGGRLSMTRNSGVFCGRACIVALSMMVLTVRPQEGPSRRAEKKPGWV